MKKLTYLIIVFLPLFSCMQKENNTTGNNENAGGNGQNMANEKKMTEFYQAVLNGHNPAMIDSFCSSSFMDHQPFPGYPPGIEGLKKGMADMMSAFPDMTCNIEMIKSWGDTVMAKFRMKGTNTGMFMGAPATNKAIDVEGIDIVVIKDGKATEHWGYMEEMKMMSQLGMGGESASKEEGEKHE